GSGRRSSRPVRARSTAAIRPALSRHRDVASLRRRAKPPAARPPRSRQPTAPSVAAERTEQGGVNKLKVLFLCTGNACRSQMSEGWARHLRGDQIDTFSAGVAPHGLDPRAVQVMAEAGVDISAHTSKHLDTLLHLPFDYVITVCDNAAGSCPI